MSSWWHTLLLFLPAAIANMTPPVANKIPYLNRWHTPMDFGHSYRGIRIFGTNKTWRGFVCGTIVGTSVGVILHGLFFADTNWQTYLLRCLAFSAGALIGDAVKSFFKRQHGVPPGSSWFPFDQIDFIVFALLCALPWYRPSLKELSLIFGTFFIGNIVVTYFSYKLGFKDKPI